MPRLELRIPPPLVALCLAALMWRLAPSLPAAAIGDTWRQVLAGLFCVAGIGTAVAGALAFRRARTTLDPLHPESSSAVVSQGVYRWTRNPMYLGMATVLLAWALALASPALILVGPFVFVAYITRFQILPEERILAAKFGQAYLVYMQRTPRWL
jgi:protein-S-isoprenylcysteine O-methyltransferase Ste14